MRTQQEKGSAFEALHAGETFVIPNPWDLGSARVLDGLGFRALATTSSGFAFTLGRLDGAATLDEVAEHVRALAAATALPVSVDLENGYDDPAGAIAAVAEAGAVGGSIEDYDPREGLYPIDVAVSRVAAAVEAARALDFPFVLTARAENHIRGNPDLDDTVVRLRAFEAAGADVLYAPGLASVGGDPRGVRGRLAPGQRAGAAEPVAGGDRGGGRATDQPGRRAWPGRRWRVSWTPRSGSAMTATSRGWGRRRGCASGSGRDLERRLGRAVREPPLAAVRGALPLAGPRFGTLQSKVRNVRRVLFSPRYAPPTGTASNAG